MNAIDWKNAGDGPKWIPIITQVEEALDLPTGLLARMAFQESSFRPGVIDGTIPSPPGALGILQLMPQFFPAVNRPIPFSDDAVKSQIIAAGVYVKQQYTRFGDWAEALAAYNYGPGNEEKYLEHRIAGLPIETQNYVSEILADVPVKAAA